jgi:N utilization substance protein B
VTDGFGVGRREARERAVQLLYEIEQRELPAAGVLAEQHVTPDPYTDLVVNGVDRDRAEIDAALASYAKGWTVERMPAMDRAVLRLAIFELRSVEEVPTAVVLNEAVELANSYSTDDSGRFVNGVLSAAAAAIRPSAE